MAVSPKRRWRILMRDQFTCQYCGARAPEVKLQVDHVRPKSKGGSDEEFNLVTACATCNQGKTDAELEDRFGMIAREVATLLERGLSVTDAYQEVSDMRISIFNQMEIDWAVGWYHFFAELHDSPEPYDVLRLIERFDMINVHNALLEAGLRFEGQADLSVERIFDFITRWLEEHYEANERVI